MFKGLLLGASGFCTLVVGADELVNGGLYLRVRDARLDHPVGEARGELILTVSERLSDFRRLLFHFEVWALFVVDYRFGRLNHLPSSTWRRVLEEDFNNVPDGFLRRLVFLLGLLCFGVSYSPFECHAISANRLSQVRESNVQILPTREELFDLQARDYENR